MMRPRSPPPWGNLCSPPPCRQNFCPLGCNFVGAHVWLLNTKGWKVIYNPRENQRSCPAFIVVPTIDEKGGERGEFVPPTRRPKNWSPRTTAFLLLFHPPSGWPPEAAEKMAILWCKTFSGPCQFFRIVPFFPLPPAHQVKGSPHWRSKNHSTPRPKFVWPTPSPKLPTQLPHMAPTLPCRITGELS